MADEEELSGYIRELLKDYRFTELTEKRFMELISDRFGIGLSEYIDDWYTRSTVPRFLVRDLEYFKFIRNERTRYQVRMKLINGSGVDGIVKVTVNNTGNRWRTFRPSRGRGGRDDASTERYVFLEGRQGKEIGLVTSFEPNSVLVDMMVSGNLPSVIVQSFDEFEERESPAVLDGARIILRPEFEGKDRGEIVVDNEDPGFTTMRKEKQSLLKRVLPAFWESDDEIRYKGLRFWESSGRWKATINSGFYGKYIRSAHFITPGDGDLKANWSADIPRSGYYDVYCHVSRIATPWGRRRRSEDYDYGSYQYIIYHDDGVEETGIDLNSATDGWNFLGSYYFSAGEAKIEMPNDGEGRFIIADAVKWVPQQ
jgi:hypothetical protein